MSIYSSLPPEICSIINGYLVYSTTSENPRKRKTEEEVPSQERCSLSTDRVNMASLLPLLDATKGVRAAVVSSIFMHHSKDSSGDFWAFFQQRLHLNIRPTNEHQLYYLVTQRIFEIARGLSQCDSPNNIKDILHNKNLILVYKEGKFLYPNLVLKALPPLLKWIGLRETEFFFRGLTNPFLYRCLPSWDLVCRKENYKSLDLRFSKVFSFETATYCSLAVCEQIVVNTFLSNFSSLQTLSLDDNFIGKLPSFIYQFTRLNYFSISNNTVRELSSSLGQLVQLNDLVLQSNQLTRLPDEISNLTSLNNLYVSRNQLESVPEALGRLHRLQLLDLRSNQLRVLPDSLSSLRNLEILDLTNNQFSEFPSCVVHLTRLRLLHLVGNQLKSIPDQISTLRSLAGIYLDYNQFSEIPLSIRKIKRIQVITISHNRIETITGTGRLKRLESITLSYNQIRTLNLGNLLSLKTLKLKRNRLTILPQSTMDLVQLEELNLAQNKISTLPSFLSKLSKLRSLNLNSNQLKTIPDSIIGLSSLRVFKVANNLFTQFPSCIYQFPVQISRIDLSNNPLKEMPNLTGLTHLKHLSLRLGNIPFFLHDPFEPYFLMSFGFPVATIFPDCKFKEVNLSEVKLPGLKVFI